MLFLLFARLSYQAPVQSHLSTLNSGKPYIPAFHLTNLQTRTRRVTACLNGEKFQSMRQRSGRSSSYVRCARDLGAITRQRSCTLFLFRCDCIYLFIFNFMFTDKTHRSTVAKFKTKRKYITILQIGSKLHKDEKE